MNETEEKLAMKILEGASLQNAELELLGKSPELLQYREVLDHAMAAKQENIEPRPSIDRAIVQYAAKAAKQNNPTGPGKAPLEFKMALALAAAAAVLVVALVIVSQKRTNPDDPERLTANPGIESHQLPRGPKLRPRDDKLHITPLTSDSNKDLPTPEPAIAKAPDKTGTVDTHDWDFAELDESFAVIETELSLDAALDEGAELVENTIL